MEDEVMQEQEQAVEETVQESVFEIPAEYKDKAWANQIHSLEDAFKKIDNQEKYISKGQLPHKDSSESDLATFSEKMRKYTSEQDYSDLVGNDAELGKALRESGVPKFQAKAVVDLIKGREAKAYSEEDFEKILGEKFKGRESDLDMAKSVLKEAGEERSQKILSKRNDDIAEIMDVLAEIGKSYAVKNTSAMAKLSEAPLGSQASAKPDKNDPKVQRAYYEEMTAFYQDPHGTPEMKRAIMKKYGYLD